MYSCGASVSKFCCVAEAGARLCASGTTASVRFSADSAATRSRWRILRAANLRLRSSADSAAVLRRWRSRRAANLTGRWDSVSEARSRLWRTRWCANLLRRLGSCPRTLLRSQSFPCDVLLEPEEMYTVYHVTSLDDLALSRAEETARHGRDSHP